MDRTTGRLIETMPLVLVDFDGTLARLGVPWDALRVSLDRMARSEGVYWDPRAGLDANLRRLRARYGEAVFRQFCRPVSRVERAGFEPERLHGPLRALLLRRGAHPWGIVSANTRAALEDACARARLRPACLVGKEDVWQGKPHPEGLLRAAALCGIPPSETLYLGDAEHDAQAARAAGMLFVHVSKVSAFPDDANREPTYRRMETPNAA